MMNKKYFFAFILFILFSVAAQSQQNYAVSINYTPVLNTNDFASVFGGKTGNRVKLDGRGLIGEMEFVALPNTSFEILESIPVENHFIYKVSTNDYPYTNSPLYIDSRFVKMSEVRPEIRKIEKFSKEKITGNLSSLENNIYMWGGNTPNGIPELLEFYPSNGNISESTKELWILKGVDCSGLLYFATGGATPRNTSSLINFGNAVDIKGMNAKQISDIVQPLDLIVWNGHVVIVLDNETTIESTPSKGVHKTDLISRLKTIMNERKPVNDWQSTSGKRFVIRRWIEQ